MLATRYALEYPTATTRLVLVNPIGLEDWKAEGVPWKDIDTRLATERKTTFDSIQRSQRATYFDGNWPQQATRWAGGMYTGPGGESVAWNHAMTADMIFNQPVLYEFNRLRTPTTLLTGRKDRTAIGKERAPAEVAKRLGDYSSLGKRTAAAIPGASLVEFDDLGHAPQVEAPERFNRALLEALALSD